MSSTRMISAKLLSVDSPAAEPPDWTEDVAEYVREPAPSVLSVSSLWFRRWRFANLFFLPRPPVTSDDEDANAKVGCFLLAIVVRSPAASGLLFPLLLFLRKPDIGILYRISRSTDCCCLGYL